METIPCLLYVGMVAAFAGNVFCYWMTMINKSKEYSVSRCFASGNFRHFKEIVDRKSNA